MLWVFQLEGGPWNGDLIQIPSTDLPQGDPPVLCYCWTCCRQCEGHMAWDLHDVPLHKALAYNLSRIEPEHQMAVYVLGGTGQPAHIDESGHGIEI